MASNEGTPKYFAGHAQAMGRQGLSELRAAFYADSNVAQPPGLGIYGTATPSEVADQRNADLMSPSGHTESVLAARLPGIDPEPPTHEPEPPNLDRE